MSLRHNVASLQKRITWFRSQKDTAKGSHWIWGRISEKIVKEKAVNKLGWLFTLGLQVANQRIVTKACQLMLEEEIKIKIEQAETKK